MRQFIAVVLVLLNLSAARAQPAAPGPGESAAIRDVIARQIDAFRHDDANAAFGFASPGIQAQMGTPGRFLDLVRQQYGPVYRPRSTAFGDLAARDGLVVQPLDVVGPDGRRARALYSMEQQPDGSWRISGCSLTESEALST